MAKAKPRPVIAALADYGTVPQDAKVGFRYVRCAKHHFDPEPCDCPPGPQYQAFVSPAFETLFGGGRGSMKTDTGLMLTARGNLGVTNPTPTDISYLNHPSFRFLVLRKNVRHLEDWFERGKRFFGNFGAAFTIDPPTFTFPSGAKGILGHMEAEDSYEKWQGQEYHLIIFEELEHCPSENLYLKILMSCRSADDALVPRMFGSANPGGPGNRWIKARWIDLKGKDGKRIAPGTLYRPPDTPLKTRMFIHATVYDNPYVCKYVNGVRDPKANDYAKTLELLPTIQQRKQWLWGDFDALQGAYFTELRETRNEDEPECAYHVIPDDAVKLAAWWPRAIGMDWGYSHPSAAVWGCWAPEGRLYIYRDMQLSHTGSMEVGAAVAKHSLADLRGLDSAHLTMFLSHDAFWRRDEQNSIAEQVKAGIDEILGREACFVLHPNEDEETLPTIEAWAAVRRRQKELSHRTNITILRASNDRIAGWNHIRNLLRWTRLGPENAEIDELYAKRLRTTEGSLAELEYRKSVEAQRDEILPKLRFFANCQATVDSLKELIHDSEGRPEDVLKVDGDDLADALRYLVIDFKFRSADAPRPVAIQQRVDEVVSKYPGLSDHGKYMVFEHAVMEFDKRHRRPLGYTFRRASGRHARIARAGGVR